MTFLFYLVDAVDR